MKFLINITLVTLVYVLIFNFILQKFISSKDKIIKTYKIKEDFIAMFKEKARKDIIIHPILGLIIAFVICVFLSVIFLRDVEMTSNQHFIFFCCIWFLTLVWYAYHDINAAYLNSICPNCNVPFSWFEIDEKEIKTGTITRYIKEQSNNKNGRILNKEVPTKFNQYAIITSYKCYHCKKEFKNVEKVEKQG